MQSPRSLRVAVIGAGPAGLVAARELRREGHDPVVFERAAGVGGTWLYDDDDGVHSSSMYASLRTNLPRECMGFLDFPFTACAGGGGDTRRFPGHAEVLRYLEEFARRFDLVGMVRFRTEVVRVRREEEGRWRVAYSSTVPQDGSSSENREEEEVLDAVVVCNGHFSEPRLADIAGIDGWPGKQMHSRNYRVPDPFDAQVVVIIGYHPSGIDISRDIAAVAKEVHVAIRGGPAAPYAGAASSAHANLWIHHSTIERAEEDGSLVFEDGSRVKADAIVHCTGYKYSFPFLDANVVDEKKRVCPLYKHVFPPRAAPGISFIGLPSGTALFPLFQLQTNWVAGVLSGRIRLPSPEEMMQDATAFYSRMEATGLPEAYTHDLHLTFDYEDWVAEQCGGQHKIEEWRRGMVAVGRENVLSRIDTYRDEWDDHHLLAQAYQHFSSLHPFH